MNEKISIIPSEEQIKVLAETLLKQEVTVTQRIGGGIDSTTFFLETASGDFVLRTSGRSSNYDAEHSVLEKVRELGVLAPRPVVTSVDLHKYPFTFSLLEGITGASLGEMPEDRWPDVLKDVGKQLVLIHSVRLAGFGRFDLEHFRKDGVLRGEEASWYEALVKWPPIFTSRIRAKMTKERQEGFAKSKLPRDLIGQIEEILNREDEVLQKVENARSRGELEATSSLLFGDLHAGHIFVDLDGKFTGLIDFNDALIGDPLLDIAYFSIMPGGNEQYKHLLKGSGMEFKENSFHLYRLLHSIRKIHTRWVAHDYLHENPEVIGYALEELNR